MSSIPQSLVDKRIAEILYERENAKRLEEERRIQAEIDAEARRKLLEAELAEKKRLDEEKRIHLEIEAAARRAIIEAQIAEKRRLDEEKRIQAEIDRAAIAAIVAVKRDEIKKKQEEIEFYRQEIIRAQTYISKINSEIISFNHAPTTPKPILSDEDDDLDSDCEYLPNGIYVNKKGQCVPGKKTWRSAEYEVDNSDLGVSKVSTLNDSLKAIVTVIRNNGKMTLHKLKEFVTKDESIALAVRDNIIDTPLSKIIQNKMKILVDMEILKPHD